ncbi:MAG: sulfur carrier protein ThiS [Actinomycetota bacterium]|nr:sulfur carrier protein ThiS [Actinomycetota bacterium]
MKLIVNGEPMDFAGPPTVSEVVGRVAPQRRKRGTAVAVNGEVVPRTKWDVTSLSHDDRLEVLDAIGGG